MLPTRVEINMAAVKVIKGEECSEPGDLHNIIHNTCIKHFAPELSMYFETDTAVIKFIINENIGIAGDLH